MYPHRVLCPYSQTWLLLLAYLAYTLAAHVVEVKLKISAGGRRIVQLQKHSKCSCLHKDTDCFFSKGFYNSAEAVHTECRSGKSEQAGMRNRIVSRKYELCSVHLSILYDHN